MVFEPLNARFDVVDQTRRNFDHPVILNETGTTEFRKNSDNLNKNVNQFEDFRFVNFQVDFVLADEVGNIEEGNQLQLQFFMLEAKFDLHSFH